MKVQDRQSAEQVRGKKARVLVVDDHAGFRTCASALLQAEGFDVVGEAEDGASALARAAELTPDWVLLDIQLPDLDGFEVTERLLAVNPELAIVLVSSRDRSSYGPLVEQSGARGFVTKADLSGDSIEGLLV
ncbi:MAG TPA: response regulator transcription factor [Gaiellaceae bacterium]|jgi:DNA-binding NarL/FixJ family response regulator